jgi:hypothetical protein
MFSATNRFYGLFATISLLAVGHFESERQHSSQVSYPCEFGAHVGTSFFSPNCGSVDPSSSTHRMTFIRAPGFHGDVGRSKSAHRISATILKCFVADAGLVAFLELSSVPMSDNTFPTSYLTPGRHRRASELSALVAVKAICVSCFEWP